MQQLFYQGLLEGQLMNCLLWHHWQVKFDIPLIRWSWVLQTYAEYALMTMKKILIHRFYGF